MKRPPAAEALPQLLDLGTKLVLEAAGLDEFCSASRLIADRVLPVLYRDHYDEGFLRAFAASLERACATLTSERPDLPNTLSELAAHAIFRQARVALQTHGRGCLDLAIQIDPDLPHQLERNPAPLSRDLERLYEQAFADNEVLALFRLDDAEAIDSLTLSPEQKQRLRFEHWQDPSAAPGCSGWIPAHTASQHWV